MKAQKVTVTITMEALSIDCLSVLLVKALENIQEEYENGTIAADDGDTISWQTKREQVEF